MKVLLYLIAPVIFTACMGQNASTTAPGAVISADTVNNLGRNIMIVYQDKKDVYWFGSWEEGVYRYDGKTMLHFTTKHGLSNNRVDEIREDKSGNMYFNTPGGIDKFDGKTFTRLEPASITESEWRLEPDDLWFRSTQDSAHVYRYDGKVLYPLLFQENVAAKRFKEMFPNTPFSPFVVYSIYKDSRGNIWFGTAALGVCRFDGKSIDWIHEDDVTEIHNGPANGVRSVIEDKEGYFWFNSLYRYDIYGATAGPNEHPGAPKFNYNRIKSIGPLDGSQNNNMAEYLSIAKDNNHELWIVKYLDGAWHYDGEKVTHYLVKDGSKNITLFSIYKDNHGTLWVGTHESGAYRFNGKDFVKFEL